MEKKSDAPTVSCQNRKVSPEVASKVCHKNVYIWDMDETLILLKSLLDGAYAAAFNGSKDSRKGVEIGKCWENRILQVCDTFFFYEQIEDYNEPYLSALSEYDDGRDLSDYDFKNDGLGYPFDDANRRKLSYRHRLIAHKYLQGLHKVLDQQMIKLWDDLYELTDSYTDGWLSSGHALLEQALGRGKSASHLEVPSHSNEMTCQNTNVLVTSGSLIPSLVKCLLFRLDDVIPHDNVYSSWEVGKLQCFSWIKERFSGPGVRFCVIGDGMEECEAAQRMNWPFIKIDLRPGAPHRFPGLTMRMVENYIQVIYGTENTENRSEQTKVKVKKDTLC